jgi:hypothetical protein
MTPALAKTIDAARDLAWRPTSNLGGRRAVAYEPRLEAHRRLVDALAGVTGLSANAAPELRYLLAASRRVAACSFSNRMGHPYYERKQAVAELRGCLITYDRSLVPASRSGLDSVDLTVPAVERRRRGRIGTPELVPALL